MNRLQALRQKKADKTAEAREILNAAGDEPMTDEQQQNYDALIAEIESLSQDIQREEQQLEAERALPAMGEGQQTAAPAQGAERSTVPAQARNDRGFDSLGDQLMAVARAGMNRGDPTATDSRLVWEAAAGANETVPSEGGFLVDSAFSTALLDQMHDMGDLLSRVFRVPMRNSNRITMPVVDEDSRKDGRRWGGVVAHWAQEGGTAPESQPTFRSLELRLQKLIGLGYATEEMLQDSAFLGAIMNQAFLEELTFQSEGAVFEGSGAGRPFGFLNSSALVPVAKEDSQPSGTVTTANIQKMWGRMPVRSKRNAVWLVNQDLEEQLFGLTRGDDTAVQLLYSPPGATNNPDQTSGRLLGRPVIPFEHFNPPGEVGDIVLVDPRSYLMADRQGIQTDSSMHVRFVYDEMCFRFTHRIGGEPAWNKPLTPYKGATQRSPFVALEAR